MTSGEGQTDRATKLQNWGEEGMRQVNDRKLALREKSAPQDIESRQVVEAQGARNYEADAVGIQALGGALGASQATLNAPHQTTAITEKHVTRPHVGSIEVTSVQSLGNPNNAHRAVGRAVSLDKQAGQKSASAAVGRLSLSAIATLATSERDLLDSGKTGAIPSNPSLHPDLQPPFEPNQASLPYLKPDTTRSRLKRRTKESLVKPKPKRLNAMKGVKLSQSRIFDVEEYKDFTLHPDGSMTCVVTWTPQTVQLRDMRGSEAMAICEREITSKFSANKWVKQKAAYFDRTTKRKT
ncbi:hypothetical protein HYQ46_002185 [Verticillium longisporum]|nr:hypothetical protein HYQ46_002185 [Verticillium longisporum]